MRFITVGWAKSPVTWEKGEPVRAILPTRQGLGARALRPSVKDAAGAERAQCAPYGLPRDRNRRI
jgi:hypothetical protein